MNEQKSASATSIGGGQAARRAATVTAVAFAVLGVSAPAALGQSGPQPTYRLGTAFDAIGDSRGGVGQDLDRVQATFESERGIASARVRASNGTITGTVVVSIGQAGPAGCDLSNGVSVTFPAGQDIAQWRVVGSADVRTLATDQRTETVSSALTSPIGGTVAPELIGRPLDCATATLGELGATALDKVAAFPLPYFDVSQSGSGRDEEPTPPADRGTNPRLTLRAADAGSGKYAARVVARSTTDATFTLSLRIRAKGRTVTAVRRIKLTAGKNRTVTLRPTAAQTRALARAGARRPLAQLTLIGGGSTAQKSTRVSDPTK